MIYKKGTQVRIEDQYKLLKTFGGEQLLDLIKLKPVRWWLPFGETYFVMAQTVEVKEMSR